MRIAEHGEHDVTVKSIKVYDEGSHIRLTWEWPPDIEQVRVFAVQDGGNADFCNEGLAAGKLFTLQEYKKQSGYKTPRLQGTTVYSIYPFVREGGEDIYYAQPPGSGISFTGQTVIELSILEKSGVYKNHEITLTADYPVAPDTICYVKKENDYPRDAGDGVVYRFGELLEPKRSVTRIVRTMKNEYLRFFVWDEKQRELYIIQGGMDGYGTV